MNNASLELGGDNWAAKDTKLLAATVSDDSGRFYPREFNFSRGSNLSATRVNADGNIEKGYENLLLQSNSFLTNWAQVNLLPPTDGQSGYDGTNDAWYFEKVGAFGRLQQSISTSGVRTLSVYLKAKDSSWVSIEAAGTNTSRQYFDLTNISKGSSNNIISSSIVDAGDGWRKCSITYEGTKTLVFIFIAEGNGQVNGTTGSLYIQDAMVNQGLVAYPYVETTTAPVAGGILEDMPRLDYSGSCPALLLEPQRTNLVDYSEYFGSYYTINSVLNKTDNAANSPEGVQNATLISENTYSSAIPVISTGNRYSLSGYQTATLYVKPENNARYFGISFGSNAQRLRTTFDFENNTFNTINYNGDVSNGSLSYEELQNGWYRIIVTANFVTLATGASYQFAFLQNNTYLFFAFQSSDNRQFYIYGLQVEQDATYPTSYIPTYGSSVTRGADVTDRGANLTYAGDYTLFIEFELTKDAVYFLNSTTGSSYTMFFENDDTYFKFGRQSGDAANLYFSNTFDWAAALGTNVKFALVKDGTDAAMFVNGTKYTPNVNTLTTGNEILDWRYLSYSTTADRQEQAYIKQLLEFETALSDTECIKLTTI